MASEVFYPPVGFHFKVEFDLPGANRKDTLFQEVSGISVELETITVPAGGERYSYKLPSRANYTNLVLKRGLLNDSELIEWCTQNLENIDDITPISVFVSLLNDQHEPIQMFHFINAWPVKWNVSNFNAEENSIAVESIELTYHFFKEVT